MYHQDNSDDGNDVFTETESNHTSQSRWMCCFKYVFCTVDEHTWLFVIFGGTFLFWRV